MKLTDAQLKQFDEEGWIFIPDCFSPEEVAVLNAEGEKIYAEEREEVWRKRRALQGRHLPLISTTRRLAFLDVIHA